MGLPEQSEYTLEELAAQWACSVRRIEDLVNQGEYVPLPAEIEKTADGYTASCPALSFVCQAFAKTEGKALETLSWLMRRRELDEFDRREIYEAALPADELHSPYIEVWVPLLYADLSPDGVPMVSAAEKRRFERKHDITTPSELRPISEIPRGEFRLQCAAFEHVGDGSDFESTDRVYKQAIEDWAREHWAEHCDGEIRDAALARISTTLNTNKGGGRPRKSGRQRHK